MIQLPAAASNLPLCKTWEASAFSFLAVRIELVWPSSHLGLLHRTLSPLATLALHRHRTARIAGDTCLANSTDVKRYICVVGKQSVGQSSTTLHPSGPTTWLDLAGTSVNLIGPFFKILGGKFQIQSCPRQWLSWRISRSCRPSALEASELAGRSAGKPMERYAHLTLGSYKGQCSEL